MCVTHVFAEEVLGELGWHRVCFGMWVQCVKVSVYSLLTSRRTSVWCSIRISDRIWTEDLARP